MKRCSISRSSAASCTAAACSKVVARPEMIHLVVKDSAARHCVRSMCPSRQKSPARQSSTLNPQRKVFSSPVSGRIRCRTDSSCTCCTCCTSPHERRVKQQRLICDTSRAGGCVTFPLSAINITANSSGSPQSARGVGSILTHWADTVFQCFTICVGLFHAQCGMNAFIIMYFPTAKKPQRWFS